MATVRLYGDLRRFGREFRLQVKSTGEAIRALVSQLPGLRQALQQGHYRVRYGRGRYLDERHLRQGMEALLAADDVIHIVPMAAGAKSGWGVFGVIAGAALVVAGFVTGNPYLIAAGVGLAVGGVASMLTQTPTASTGNETERDNRKTTFSNIDNLSPQGRQVPIAYGTVLAGSLTVSQGIYSV